MSMATDPSASLFSIAAAETADAQLARHREWLRRFEDAAEAFAAAGQPEDAVAAAAAGARIALQAHPGVMTSPRLERVLTDVAERHLEPVERAKPPARPVRRVLHIVTETYPTGGHSRVLWRWISRDRGRVHTVVT